MTELKNIKKSFGENAVFKDFSLKLTEGTKTIVKGASGCGKTTLLRVIAGLEAIDGGEAMRDEKLAYMFQEPRLLPWKSALDNIRAVLSKEHISLADKYISAVGLADDAKKFPHELSGGMAQRVAFARFLAFAESTVAKLLLLDEPFSALDKETAAKMLDLLIEFSVGKTLVLVTHDESDITFADNVIELSSNIAK